MTDKDLGISERLGRTFDRMDRLILEAQVRCSEAYNDTLTGLGRALDDAHTTAMAFVSPRAAGAEVILRPLEICLQEVDALATRVRRRLMGDVFSPPVFAQHLRAWEMEQLDELDSMPGMSFLKRRLGPRYDEIKAALAYHGASTLFASSKAAFAAAKGGGALLVVANLLLPQALQTEMVGVALQLAQKMGASGDPSLMRAVVIGGAVLWLGSMHQVLKGFTPAALHGSRDAWLERIQAWRERLGESWLRFAATGLEIIENSLFHSCRPLSPQSKQLLWSAQMGDMASIAKIPGEELQSFDVVCKLLCSRYAMGSLQAAHTATHLLSDPQADVNAVVSVLRSREIPWEWRQAFPFDSNRCADIPEGKPPTAGAGPALAARALQERDCLLDTFEPAPAM